MKRSLIMILTLGFLLVLPVQAWAVELTLRNEEHSPARVAIAYKKGDSIVVEGWHILAVDQSKILSLPNVGPEEVFIRVEFDNPDIEQSFPDVWTLDCVVINDDFTYEMQSASSVLGLPPALDSSEAYKATFRKISTMYKNGEDKLHFNLSAAAG